MKITMRAALIISAIGLLLAGAMSAPPAAAEGGNWPAIGTLVGGIPQDVVLRDHYVYVAACGALSVIDIADRANPVQVGYCDTPVWATAVAVSGAYAYVADLSGRLRVIDISDPSRPVEVGAGDTSPGDCCDVEVVGHYAYVAGVCQGVVVFDVLDPTHPIRVANCALKDATAYTLAWSGRVICVTTNVGDLRIVNVDNPLKPTEVGKLVFTDPVTKLELSANTVAARNNYAYCGVGGIGMGIADISNPAKPEQRGACAVFGVQHITLMRQSLAYVACGYDGAYVVNVADPPFPYVVSSWLTPGYVGSASAVQGIGGYAYVADDLAGLRVVDVREPDFPQEVASSNAPNWALAVAVVGHYAYVADGLSGVRIFDTTNPLNPVQVAVVDTPQYAQGVAVYANRLYVADGYGGLRVADVSNPFAPVFLGAVGAYGYTWDVAIAPDATVKDKAYAYVASRGGVTIYDVSDPTKPEWLKLLGSIATSEAVDIAVLRTYTQNYVYIACKYAGVQVIDVKDPKAPVAKGTAASHDCAWGVAVSGRFSGPYLYVADGHAGLRVVDVSNPESLVEAGHCATPGYARKVALFQGHAVVADNQSGMRLIEIGNPALPVDVGSVDTPGYATDVAVQPGYVYLNPDLADIQERYAYVADDYGGLRVIELPNPVRAPERGFVDRPGRAQALALYGNLAYVADGGAGIRIVNVADRTRPVEVGRFAEYSWPQAMVVSSHYLYVVDSGFFDIYDLTYPVNPAIMGSWMSPGNPVAVAVSGGYAYVADNYPGVRVLDVSNPMNPIPLGYWDTIAWAWGVAVSGNYLYVADEWSGLRVLDASNPAHLMEVGYYDTPGHAVGVTVAGRYAYVADSWAGLRIIDVSSPTAPVEVGSYSPGGSAQSLAYKDGRIYLADGYGGLRIVDVTHPQAPKEIGYWDTPGTAYGVAVDATHAFVADYGWGLMIFPVTPPAPGGISGHVRVAGAGAPLEAATVEAYSGDELRGTATTDSDGAYTIDGMAAGDYTVTARKAGYIEESQPVTVDPGEIATADFSLDISGLIAGQVMERGTSNNIVGATVSAFLSGELQMTATTDSRGIYLICTNLPAGQYRVSAVKYGYTSQGRVGISVAQGQTAYVNFQLDHIDALKGQVKDGVTGLPIVGATVGVYQGDTLVRSALSQAPYGLYVFGTELPVGTYTVVASLPTYVRQAKPGVTVAAGATTYANFNLAVSGKLKGQVKDKMTGAPIIGATVTARTGGVDWATGVTTAPYGIYEMMSDLPAGTYSVRASKSGYADFGRIGILVSGGATTYVNFPLQPQ